MAKSLRVGVLLVPSMQILDASPIDLFGMLDPSYLELCNLPAPLTNLAVPVSIHYISASGPGTNVAMTASASLLVTDSLTSPAVQPGQLDTLLIPGPDPRLIPDEEVVAFLRKHERAQQTDILVICTGQFIAGHAGLLDGKRVTGPRALLDQLGKKFPKAQYVERRWERDGRLWSSAGITNGLDLTAAYLHEKVSKELADLVCAMAEVGDRGQDYDTGKTSNTIWWLWLILRSAIKGKGNTSKKEQ